MFQGCTSLTSAPALPATTLADRCYQGMFYNCTNIKLSTTQDGTYKTPFRIPSTGTGTVGTDSLRDMFTGTGGSFKTTPTINTTYYIAHTYMNNVTLNAKWTENMSMTPDGLTAGQDASGYVTESISRTLGNLVHCAKQTSAEITTLSYMKYIMEGMMVARVVDFDNLKQSLLLGDFNRLNCFKNRKRCIVKSNGNIGCWYGDSYYTEDGTIGDVMVYQPKFYYKVEPIELEPIAGSFGYHIRKAIYYISDAPIGGFKLHPAFVNPSGNEVDHFFIGAYEGCIYNLSRRAYDLRDLLPANFNIDKFASISGAKPASGLNNILTASNLLTLCKNKGDGWYSMGIKQYSMNQLMMLIEYGPDPQTGIGYGVINITENASYNCSSLTGSTSILGNNTGMAASTINEINGTQTTYTTNDKVSVSYRGMENPYGNIWELVQGGTVYGDGTDRIRGGQLYVSDDFNYEAGKHTDNYKPIGFTLPTFGATAGTAYGGYIKAFGYGDEKYDWVMMGSDAGTVDTSIIKDYHYTTTKLNGSNIPCLGGSWNSGYMAGAFYWNLNMGVNARYRSFGGRLCNYGS
jgi:hypothetical protein